MNAILSVGVILLAGLLFAGLIKKIKFPSVTSYLILGIILGHSILNIISPKLVSASGLISNVVLGFIAFSIGRNFSLENFHKIGNTILWISIFEALCAFILVTFVLFLILGLPFYLSLLFGAISSATAPAATVMVIKEYKSKGNFTDTLLGVVAIDDAWCLIIFAVSLAIAKSIFAYKMIADSLLVAILKALLEIFGAFILGGFMAYFMSKLKKYIRTQTEFLIYTLGFIFLTIGLAIGFHLSVLLANMFFGAVLVNIDRDSFRFYDTISNIDSPLYLLFFVLAGVNMEISLLKNIGLIGLFYLFFRVVGKSVGAYLGGVISNASLSIRKYIGLGLVPQAGVALGCALVAKAVFPEIGGMIFSTIVGTTVVYEIIGPICTKLALEKAGEISQTLEETVQQKEIK